MNAGERIGDRIAHDCALTGLLPVQVRQPRRDAGVVAIGDPVLAFRIAADADDADPRSVLRLCDDFFRNDAELP